MINEIEKVDFNSAFDNRVIEKIKHKQRKFNIYYIGLSDLIRNKKAVNRYRNKEDLKFLNKLKNNL